ncbi:MAG: GrdX family protein [Oscillospiraceae bacterium]|nr:GrdX family protein [Oscillospiraceae bacterium]
MDIIVTNNPLVKSAYEARYQVIFEDTDILGILTKTRDLVHKGHTLLTHPLSGSVKPNETPYKTVLLSAFGKGGVDNKKPADMMPASVFPQTDALSVDIIGQCIETALKFPPKRVAGEHKADLQTIDLSLIEAALRGNDG